MTTFNFNDLNKQAKIGYNALYNVVFNAIGNGKGNGYINSFTIPLCLNSDNKVILTEKNFIYFDSVIDELKVFADYTITKNNGRAVEDIKTDFSTVTIYWSDEKKSFEDFAKKCNFKHFDFSSVDTSKLLKRDGKAEKAKTAENKTAEAEKTVEAEKTAEALEAKTAEVETLKKEVAKKEEQLNKKAIEEFNDDALMSIADCIEVLIKKHCPIPSDFNFASFESDLFKVIGAKWDLKVLDK
jgi:hypothetical protein